MTKEISTLAGVVSVLENVTESSGITLTSIVENLCQKFNVSMNKAIKTKTMKAVISGLKKSVIVENNGKFSLNVDRVGQKCANLPLGNTTSVPSMSIGAGQVFATSSLTACGKRRKPRKRVKNNYTAKIRKLTGTKNGTKHLTNTSRRLSWTEFPSADLEVALSAIVQVQEDNERLIRECKNVNKSLRQRYQRLKKLKKANQPKRGNLSRAESRHIKRRRKPRGSWVPTRPKSVTKDKDPMNLNYTYTPSIMTFENYISGNESGKQTDKDTLKSDL